MTMPQAATISRAPRVLIADDDPIVVQFLTERCARMGFEVQVAVNGLQAAVKAQQNWPDVLIADVNMPGVDGLSLCARLLDAGKKALSVIVITGSGSLETVDSCRSFGAIYVRKGPELWDIVRSALAPFVAGLPPVDGISEAPVFRSEMRERPRVLVVDDDPEVSRFLGSRLVKAGVDPLFASDGVRGYRIAVRERPSVIISDYLTPDGDANYLLCRLRGTPATEKTPVFVISGRRLDEAAETHLRRDILGHPGAVRFFAKPLDIDELFLGLQRYCALDYKAGGFLQ
jgi:CheY-like chemotaxis protein